METAAGQRKLIVGLGATGMSCVRYLAARGEPCKVVDSRTNPPALTELQRDYPDVVCELGAFRQQTFLQASELVVSPGVSLKLPVIASARAKGIPVTGDIAVFARQTSAPIIAVTGSNGKSTVVAMLAAILTRAGLDFGLGGNLDGADCKPALNLLLEPEKPLYLLEVSSFQLETTACLGAELACILNISADHLDRYDDFADYIAAKQRIYRGAKRIVINRDDPQTCPQSQSPVWTGDFGFSRPTANGTGLLLQQGQRFLALPAEKIIAVSAMKVFGEHNIANALAAAALASAVGVNSRAIRQALGEFTGLPHRCQWVGKVAGVEFYNDSKGTNVAATMAAVQGLGQRIGGQVLLIAGGVGKGADFSSLLPVLRRWVKRLILIGRDAAAIAAGLAAALPICFARDLPHAVAVALQHAAPADAVLLSPACASFDMFDNYQHRGDCFIRAVEGLQCR